MGSGQGRLDGQLLFGVQACNQGHPQHLHHIQAMVKASAALGGAGLLPCRQAQVTAPLPVFKFRHYCMLTESDVSLQRSAHTPTMLQLLVTMWMALRYVVVHTLSRR